MDADWIYIVNADEVLQGLIQVPVRKTQIPNLWDQYLLYGVQTGKRERSEGQDEKAERLSYLSMCLTKNELEENNYMVVKSKSRNLQMNRCDTQNMQKRYKNKAFYSLSQRRPMTNRFSSSFCLIHLQKPSQPRLRDGRNRGKTRRSRSCFPGFYEGRVTRRIRASRR